MTTFDHEKLDVYQIALEFVATVGEVIAKLPTGRHNLADQLDRAATSVVLNIAEGAGEFSRAEKARFYRMAKRSATECAAALDVARVRKLTDEKLLEIGREMLLRVVAMLIRMIHGLESGAPRNTKADSPT
ncbi:MAG: four helix bundle protein [Planctomycetes bacterium]|nr:four helix bundle protein [Planctomycetota bacterium]